MSKPTPLSRTKKTGLPSTIVPPNSILAGERGPKRDVTLLNAAAALVAAGLADTLLSGAQLAAQAVDSGAAARTLERWVAVSRSA